MKYIILMLFISLSPKVKAIDVLIVKHSQHFNLDPQLVRAIIKVESNFNNNAVSHTKDYGLMQVNEKTAKLFGLSIDKIKKNKDYAVYCGTFYLSYLRYKYSHKDKYWWARYHSSTPHLKEKYIRRILNVYHFEGSQTSPRRYYPNKRFDISQWIRSISTNQLYVSTMGNKDH